ELDDSAAERRQLRGREPEPARCAWPDWRLPGGVLRSTPLSDGPAAKLSAAPRPAVERLRLRCRTLRADGGVGPAAPGIGTGVQLPRSERAAHADAGGAARRLPGCTITAERVLRRARRGDLPRLCGARCEPQLRRASLPRGQTVSEARSLQYPE